MIKSSSFGWPGGPPEERDSSAAAAAALSFLRRINQTATSNATMPITPKATPRPIPIAAPVDNPAVVVELEVELEVGAEAVGADKIGVRIAEGEEVGVGVDGEEDDDDELEELGVGVGCLMFQPTTAMAPTIESSVIVAVAVSHAVESPSGVDANVTTMPEDTVERQSPAIEPRIPFASV